MQCGTPFQCWWIFPTLCAIHFAAAFFWRFPSAGTKAHEHSSQRPTAYHMEKETLYQGKFLRLCKRDGWEFVEVHRATGVVGILAETANDEVILIEQVRKSLNRVVVELPAGLAGDNGEIEALKIAAKRELLEETGYSGGRWKSLGFGATSPGISPETVEIFHAKGVKKVEDGGGVEGENITTLVIPKTELRSWLEKKRKAGAMVDFRVFAALWLAGVL